MTFPTTPGLVDFTIQPNGGPPPTANFDATPAIGASGMVVDTGLCIVDPMGGGVGDAPYIAQAFTSPVEVWAILGPLPVGNDVAFVYISDLSTVFYVFAWSVSLGDVYFTLTEQVGPTNIWTSAANEFPTLTEGGGLGMRANADGSIELWTYDGSIWTNIHTEMGLALPSPVTIGLGGV